MWGSVGGTLLLESAPSLGTAAPFASGLGLSKLCSLKSCFGRSAGLLTGWELSPTAGETPGPWLCQAGVVLLVLCFEAAPHFSPQLELRIPKSFVNSEVRLLKSIFSALCKHCGARTEV